MAINYDYAPGATPLDPDEAAGLIPSHIANHAQLNEWEMVNILEGEHWAFSRKHKNMLDSNFVRRLHKRMFGDTWRWAGTFRTTEKNIGLPADRVGDACDLCPFTSGADNRDPDKDGLGNACDDNDDNDKWIDSLDNCPNDPNDDQLDWDDNDIGYACDPIERTQYGLVIKGYNNKFITLNPNFRIPIPICPNCGANYLPNFWQTRLDLVLPVTFKASVINSAGKVVTKSPVGSVSQILKFNPAPFALRRVFATSSSIEVVDDAQMTDAMRELTAKQEAVETADEMNYYLRLDPIPGTDLEQSYPLDIGFTEEIELPKLFLPTLHR